MGDLNNNDRFEDNENMYGIIKQDFFYHQYVNEF